MGGVGERERKMIMIALKQHKQLSFPIAIKTKKSLIGLIFKFIVDVGQLE